MDPISESPYLTSAEAQRFLRYETLAGFMKAVHRWRIPHLQRGKRRLFLKTDLVRVWSRPVGYRPRGTAKNLTGPANELPIA
jgi:hypothetical protein